MTRWQELVDCTCIYYGCVNNSKGYRVQTVQNRARHRRADKQRLEKDLTSQATREQSAQDICAVDPVPPDTLEPADGLVGLVVTPGSGGLLSPGLAPSLDPEQPEMRYNAEAGFHLLLGISGDSSDDESGPLILAGAQGLGYNDHDVDDPDEEGDDSLYFNQPILQRQSQQPDDVTGEPLPPAETALRAQTDLTLDENARTLTPRAFAELPAIRLLYLQTILQSIFSGDTWDDSTKALSFGLDLIQIASGTTLPLYPKPARTLVTARRRMGIDADDYIEKQPICTVCFKFYTYDELLALQTPACTVRRCKGIVWYLKRDAKGVEKRVPSKIQPHTSFLKNLQRLLLRPDFVAHLRFPSERRHCPQVPDHEYMHDFHDGAAYGQLELGLERIRLADGTVTDVKTHNGANRLTLASVRRALSLTLFADWFGVTSGRPHSTGGVYVIFNNLDRSVRFLQRNVLLLLDIAGPKEPSLEQINHVLAPFVREVEILHRGISVNMHGQPEPVEMFGGIEARVFDVQGARKCEGAASHAHKLHPCNFCHITHAEINLPAGYDVANFAMRDDTEQLIAAWRSREATTQKARQDILDESGSRWTEFMALPGWKPVSMAAIDYMHNFYLGITKNLFMDFLVNGYLFNKKTWDLFDTVMASIKWPSGIGRLPTNLGENHSLPKADQWRRWLNIQCTMLWLCWRDDHDRISCHAPDVPANAKNEPTFVRNLARIYEIFLYAAIAEKILASESISMDEVKRGHRYLQRCCQEMLRLGIHLVPNHHLAMHYPQIFRLFGPVYAWWLYAQERFNGEQECVNHNGKSGGAMELTLLRNWIGKHRFYELVSSLPADALPQERALIEHIAKASGIARGTLHTQLAGFALGTTILKPKAARKPTNLCNLPPFVYRLLLGFARRTWPDIKIMDDLNCDPTAVTFSAEQSARKLPFVSRCGARFGSMADHRTEADKIACVDLEDGRVPCRILYHFEVEVTSKEPVVCSIIERLCADERIPTFPWSMYSTDLGVYVAYADRYQAPEAINATQLAAAVAVIPFTSKILGETHPLWAIHSFDRTGIEPVDEWFNKLSDELEAEPGNDN